MIRRWWARLREWWDRPFNAATCPIIPIGPHWPRTLADGSTICARCGTPLTVGPTV